MFKKLNIINTRPEPFEFYTTEELWADEYRSKQMLKYHLDETIDVSSRKSRFISKSVRWIINHFNLDKNSSLVDFGCGPGLYTSLFAKQGIQATGIDFSYNSICYAKKIAKENSLNINYFHQNYLEFKSNEKFDLIIMIMCDFCALSPIQREKLLKIFKQILKDDGAILLDVYSLQAFDNRKEIALYEKNQLNNFWAKNDYYGFLNTYKYENEKVCLDKYTIVEETKTGTVYNWLQYFDENMIRKEFENNHFQIEEFFGDVAGSNYSDKSDEFAIVARKQI